MIIYDDWTSIIGDGILELPIPYAALSVFLVTFISIWVCCFTGNGQCRKDCTAATKGIYLGLRDSKQRAKHYAEAVKRADSMDEDVEEGGETADGGVNHGTRLSDMGVDASGSAKQIEIGSITAELDGTVADVGGLLKAEVSKPIDKARELPGELKNGVEELIQSLPYCQDLTLNGVGKCLQTADMGDADELRRQAKIVTKLFQILDDTAPIASSLTNIFNKRCPALANALDAAVSLLIALCEGFLVGAFGFYATLLSVTFDLILVLSSFDSLGFTPNIDFSGVSFTLLRGFSASLPFDIDIGTITFFSSILQALSTYLEQFWAQLLDSTACISWHIIIDTLVAFVFVIPVYYIIESDVVVLLKVYWQKFDWSQTPSLLNESKWRKKLYEACKKLEAKAKWMPNPLNVLGPSIKLLANALGAALFKLVQFIVIFLCGRVYNLLIYPSIFEKSLYTATYNEALAARCGVNVRTSFPVVENGPSWLSARAVGEWRNPQKSNYPWRGPTEAVAEASDKATGPVVLADWYWDEGNKTTVVPATGYSTFFSFDLYLSAIIGILCFFLFVVPIVCVYMPLVFTTRDHQDWKVSRLLKRMLYKSDQGVRPQKGVLDESKVVETEKPRGMQRLFKCYELVPTSTGEDVSTAPTYTYKLEPARTRVSLKFGFCWNEDPERLHTKPRGKFDLSALSKQPLRVLTRIDVCVRQIAHCAESICMSRPPLLAY